MFMKNIIQAVLCFVMFVLIFSQEAGLKDERLCQKSLVS